MPATKRQSWSGQFPNAASLLSQVRTHSPFPISLSHPLPISGRSWILPRRSPLCWYLSKISLETRKGLNCGWEQDNPDDLGFKQLSQASAPETRAVCAKSVEGRHAKEACLLEEAASYLPYQLSPNFHSGPICLPRSLDAESVGEVGSRCGCLVPGSG